jgi:hypothetical protein
MPLVANFTSTAAAEKQAAEWEVNHQVSVDSAGLGKKQRKNRFQSFLRGIRRLFVPDWACS